MYRKILLSLLVVVAACGGSVGIDSVGTGTGGLAATSFGGFSGTGGAAGGTAATGGWISGTGGAGQNPAAWTACGPSDTCILEPAVSCLGCEPVPLTSFTAINSAYTSEYLKSLPQLECVSGPCANLTPDQLGTPNYYATCEQGQCQAVDIRTSPLSACSTSSDCYVRSGTSCCGCGTGNWVAASSKANVEQVLCAPAAGCAADCAISVASCLGASCITSTGHCSLSLCPD
jgi:hypothetical protein